MRKFLWILMTASLGGFVGCSEFIGPVERNSNTNTTIDVVGEPTDPTADSSKTADILGSETTNPEGTAAIADSIPESSPSDLDSKGLETTTDGPTEPDVLGNIDNEKPDTLKTSGKDAGKKPF